MSVTFETKSSVQAAPTEKNTMTCCSKSRNRDYANKYGNRTDFNQTSLFSNQISTVCIKKNSHSNRMFLKIVYRKSSFLLEGTSLIC